MAKHLLFIAGNDIDYFYDVENFLSKGEAGMAIPLGTKVGGCILNAASVCSKLGSNVKVIDYLKQDDPGTDLIIDSLKSFNVDTGSIQYSKDASNGICLIFKKDDEKCIYVIEPKRPYFDLKDIKDTLDNTKYVYTLMHTLKLSFENIDYLKQLKNKGTKFFFDGESQYNSDYEIEYLKELASGLFINKSAYERLNKKCSLEELFKHNLEFACITDGSKGSTLYLKDEVIHQDIYPVKVIDSTGAGDSFAGSFIHFLDKGLSYKECLKYAALNGALACIKQGGTAGAVSEEELIKFEENY